MNSHVLQALGQIEASVALGIWEAHRGCAVLAGVLLVHQGLTGQEARGLIESHVRSSLEPRPTSPESASISMDSFAQRLLHELGIGAREPREIGHDVIYSAYVLRALEVFQIEPWESLLEALLSLVRKIKNSGPGWITVNGKNETRPLAQAEAPTGAGYREIFSSFDRPLSMEKGDMQLGHLLTHGHAIEMLRGHATASLLSGLDLAYRKRLFGLRAANREERDIAPPARSPADPRLNGYWDRIATRGDMHGHVFKYAYSFLDLTGGRITEPDLQAFGRIVWPG